MLICQNEQEAADGVKEIMLDKKFGASGNHVVVEEFLTGPEVSVLSFCDGKTVKPMVSSMDHKRALDHDEGLNTGGMGTVAPNPYYTPAVAERCMQEIFLPTVAAMQAEGCPFKGCLYFGLMLTPDGLHIDLNKVTRKYEGLDGTELAISESQERMAVAVAAEDAETFMKYAAEENLEATIVATVTEEKRMREVWNGKTIVDLSREFLNSNGAERHADAHILQGHVWQPQFAGATFEQKLESMVSDLNVCSQKGLGERFDSTIGAATVLMPYGGKYQLTPTMAMAAKLPVDGETTTCSGMAWGFNPYLTEADPYRGAYMAVVESVTKLVCAGFHHEDMYLTFQEYFEHMNDKPERWGKPLAALLGALDAQMGLGIASIGGKDSMSGSFEGLDVPPTLVSFATAIGNTRDVQSPEFKKANSSVVILRPNYKNGLPEIGSLISIYKTVEQMIDEGKVLAAATPGYGGVAEALFKMCVGNHVGLQLSNDIDLNDLFKPAYGAVILELLDASAGEFLGFTTVDYTLEAEGKAIDLDRLQELWEQKLEPVFPYRKAGEFVPALEHDCPANKRIAMAEGFLAADAILNILLNVSDGLVVYPKVVRARVMAALPFMASENIMMKAVKKGGDRQELHERLREHAVAAAAVVKQEGKPNDMIARVEADPAFGLTREEIEAELSPEAFTGRSAEQVTEFLRDVIQPVLDANKEDLGQHVELNV